MICQKCGLRNATVHITKIFNDNKTELNLCNVCAERQNDKPLAMSADFGAPQIGLDDIIAGFFGMNPSTKNSSETFESPQTMKSCEFCRTTLSYIRGEGKVGCAKCYDVFKDELIPIIKKVHGTSHHSGNCPEDQETLDVVQGETLLDPRLDEIAKLKKEMSESIEKEDYEKAAVIRDRIKNIENELEEEKNIDNQSDNGGDAI